MNFDDAERHFNEGNDFYSIGLYDLAAGKYAQAWQVWGVDLAHISNLDGYRAKVLMNWASVLVHVREIEKFEQFWQIIYGLVEKECEQVWQIIGVDRADREDFHSFRVVELIIWAHTLEARGQYTQAAENSEHAWQLLDAELAENADWHAERGQLLIDWAQQICWQGDFDQSADKYAQAWQILGIDLSQRSDLDTDRVRLLFNWGLVLYAGGHYVESAEKYNAAWQVLEVCLAHHPHHPYLPEYRAILLTHWAATLYSSNHLGESADKCMVAWQILSNDLADREELNVSRAKVLMNWAKTLHADRRYVEAAEKYVSAWQILTIDLAEREELDTIRASGLFNWARTLEKLTHYDQSSEKDVQAWMIYAKQHTNDFDSVRRLFKISLILQTDWRITGDLHVQLQQISVELCKRLEDQNLVFRPSWLNELYRDFSIFHLRWMEYSLDDGNPEKLVDILSRVSSWRMASALLDELETMVPAEDGDFAAKTLQRYQVLRLEVRRLQQSLQEKEDQAGERGTDFSGIRSLGMEEHNRSPEAQARRIAEIDDLRAKYDLAYTQMQRARDEAARVPGYEVLSIDRHVLDSQKLLAQLKEGQAILIVFDHQAMGDNREEAQQLNGALLLKGGEVHWHPIDDIVQGSAFLNEFEVFVRDRRAGGTRGSTMGDDNAELSGWNGFAPVYGEFRRGDSRTPDTTAAREPLVYQGQPVRAENLWDSLGNWVEGTIWEPLKQKGLLEGVRELALVTQGQQAHTIPWHMRAPIPTASIRRYPGLMFYAMSNEIMPRAEYSNEPMLGIAHYQGKDQPLPFAPIEAEILGQIWAQSERTTVQHFDYLKPQGNAGYVHVAGHGTHTTNSEKQTALAGLSVGNDTYWGLAQLMNSPSRPKEVYLSCCVAGRTTDLAGEQYGVTSALLQHGTREVVASNVSLSDMWGSVLSIATHSLMQQHKLSMRAALYQAQLMVTGQQDWDERAWYWVRQAFEARLAEMEPISGLLQQRLVPLLQKLQRDTITMKSAKILEDQLNKEMQSMMRLPHMSLLQFDDTKWSEWVIALAVELREHNGRADEEALQAVAQRYARKIEEALNWTKSAPPLIAGSLIYATGIYG